MEDLHLEDYKKRTKFIGKMNGFEGEIRYRFLGDDTLELLCTEVAEEARGKGFAHALVDKTLSLLKINNIRFKPTCSFVSYFLQSNGEYGKLIKK